MKAYLIDFENVKSKGLTGIEQLSPDDKVIIFYSENSDTISFEMHRKVMTSEADIEYLKVRVGGKNALDFQLSTLLGYLLAKELYTHIFIISGDKGFDKLHDFWNVSFADKNSVIVFRTHTLASAVSFANTYKGKLPVIAVEPSEKEDAGEEAVEAADTPAFEEAAVEPETAPAEEIPAEEPVPVEVRITKTSRRRGRRPQSAYEMIRSALLGKFDLSDEETQTIVSYAAESEDKEDLHNALAKIFKAQATDLYKVLRPKYLRIKEAIADGADTVPEEVLEEQPAVTAEPVPEPQTAEEEAVPVTDAEPQEEPSAEPEVRKTRKRAGRRRQTASKKTPLGKAIEKLLKGECSKEEIAAVNRIFEETDTKQKLYISIVKEYKKDRGCEIYNLIKSDYSALSKLKEEAAQEV